MLRTLLVDDDAQSMQILDQALALFDDVSVVGRITNGADALRFVRENSVDLLFLDIEMDGMNGFELAEHLHRHYPDVLYVFVTGHTDFAVDGYAYQPLSFLVKPIRLSHLERVLELAREKAEASNVPGPSGKQIGLHVDARLEIVNLDDVAYLETVGRKVHVVCRDGRVLETAESLKKLCQVFEDYGFYRCHQSFVVQVALIESIKPDMFHHSYLIRLRGSEKEIPLSRDRYAALRTMLDKRGIRFF